MLKPNDGTESSDQGGHSAYRIRVPGFITDEEIGLGDAIKRATSNLGIQPCGGCDHRAAVLNRWLVFTNRR